MQFASGMCVGDQCVCEGIIPSSSISFMFVEPPSADEEQIVEE
jgi:hypothetical protein